MADQRVQQLIRAAEDLKRDRKDEVCNLEQQVRSLERQLADAKRLPDSARLQAQLGQSLRETRRAIDRLRNDMRLLDRHLGDYRRLR